MSEGMGLNKFSKDQKSKQSQRGETKEEEVIKGLIKDETVRKKLPGMRIIKTAIAVYLCFLVSLLTKMSPIYSSIAAIICMQTSPEDGFKVGKFRMIGTLIGGVFGFIGILVMDLLKVNIASHSHYFILSLLLIPLIYINVMFEFKDAATISCVVFLSITISHSEDSALIWFVLGRVVNTLIGVIISVAVNGVIRPPKYSKK